MRIGIEAQRIFRKNKHGMDYVVLEEIRRLQQTDGENEYFIFVKPGEDRCLDETANCHIVELKCPSYPLWEQWALPRAVHKYRLDLLHCTANTAPLWLHTPLVLTLHDIIFLEKRDTGNRSIYQNLGWWYRRLVVPRIVNKCVRIITVSDFERNNIIRRLNLQPDKVCMIYNGYNEWFKPQTPPDNTLGKYADESGFFFFFGNTDPKKNTERTIQAYAHYLKRSERKRKLLIADLSCRYLERILKDYGLEDIRPFILTADYIDNADLPQIYSQAFAFLYTSLRESFGIPLLEAMACGTPVITSNTSSMPEIGGNGAAMVDPTDVKAMGDMMIRLETDTDLRRRLRLWGLERARQFSWATTARQLLQLYVSVGKEVKRQIDTASWNRTVL